MTLQSSARRWLPLMLQPSSLIMHGHMKISVLTQLLVFPCPESSVWQPMLQGGAVLVSWDPVTNSSILSFPVSCVGKA